jgi:hypothetical protein
LNKQVAEYLAANKLQWPMIHDSVEDMAVEEEA